MSIQLKDTQNKYILDWDETTSQLKVNEFSYGIWNADTQKYNMNLSHTYTISGGGTGGGSGTSGTSGTSGSSGTSGTSGSIGATGSQGPSGISAGQTYYFNQGITSSVSGYKVLSTEPVPNGGVILTQTLTGNETGHLVSSYITEQLGFAIIPSGTQRFHIHILKPAENDHIEMYCTIQLANSSGTPIGPTISTSNGLIPWVDVTTPSETFVDLVLPTTGIDPTNRMIVKIWVTNNDSTSHVIKYYTQGTQYYSFVTTSVGVIGGTSGTSGTAGTSGSSGSSGTAGTSGSSASNDPQVVSAMLLFLAVNT